MCVWLCLNMVVLCVLCICYVHTPVYICCMRGEETQWFIRTRVSEGHSVLLKRTLSWLSERNSMCVESDDVIQMMMCTTSTLVVDFLCFCIFVFQQCTVFCVSMTRAYMYKMSLVCMGIV